MKKLLPLFMGLCVFTFFLSGCGANLSSDEKMEFEQLEWPSYENAKQIPVPKSTMADVQSCNDVTFDFYLANTTLEDYKEYIEECKARGFTLDVVEQENRYHAFNEGDYELTVQHQEGDIMYIRIIEGRFDVELKLLHANKTSADMYNLRIEIDGSYEDSSEQGDEAITFTSYLKEGNHTLIIENSDDDDINGRIEFTVSNDGEYFEFEINCLSNKIEIQPGIGNFSNNDEETSDTSSQQTIVDTKAPLIKNDSFNLTDRELIDWMNSFGDFTVSYIDLGIDSKVNTGYSITMSDGETGVLILNHGNANQNHSSDIKKQNVCGILTSFDEMSSSLVIPLWVASRIDSSFSIDDAIEKVVVGDSYSKGNMTIVYLEDSEVALLAPSTYIESII